LKRHGSLFCKRDVKRDMQGDIEKIVTMNIDYDEH